MNDLVDWLTMVIARRTPLEAETSAAMARVAAVLLSLALLYAGYRTALLLTRRVLGRRRGDGTTVARHRTLEMLLANVLRWMFAFIVLGIVLRSLGVDVSSVVVSAGVVGLVVGFGAQSLIRDLITGAFLLFENLIAVGDVVEVGGKTGTVESIGLRVTTFRTEDGLRVVPNGSLTDFVNRSRTASDP